VETIFFIRDRKKSSDDDDELRLPENERRNRLFFHWSLEMRQVLDKNSYGGPYSLALFAHSFDNPKVNSSAVSTLTLINSTIRRCST